MVTEPTRWVDEAANISRHEAEFVSGASTIGELIGFDPIVRQAEPCEPPRLEGQPPFPAPGIYFNLSDEEYQAIHAASFSSLKRLIVSSADYWVGSNLNPDRDADKEDDFGKRPNEAFFDLGKAYHCRIIEGKAAFDERFAIGISKDDYEDLLITTDDVKVRLIELGAKPVTKNADGRAAKKEDWVEQLLDLQPDALIWDAIHAQHAEANAGKIMVSAEQYRRIEIAAKMIEGHPELRHAFTGGWPEVSIFWYCPRTGCAMKARIDYLKMRAIVDKKTFSTKGGKPVDRAIEATIGSMKYNAQHAIYDDGVAQIRKLIREQGEAVIHGTPEQTAWALKWSKQEQPPAFMLVMQKTGAAPVTRGKIMPRGTVFSVTNSRVDELKRKWVECVRTYGAGMWLDIAPIDTIEDESIPLYATEI